MADSDLIALLGPSDLANFSNTVQQSDPYSLGGAGLNSWRPDMSTWSPATQGITSFGKSFLAGYLGIKAQENVQNQLNSVTSVLPSLYKDPNSVATPEGVDPSAFAAIKANVALKSLANKQRLTEENRTAVRDVIKSVLGEGVKSGTIAPGDALKAVATGDYSGVLDDKSDPLKNPNSPDYKISKDKAELERQLANDFNVRAAPYKYREQGLKALTEAFKDTGGTSDYELIRRGAQMVEPGLAVRADDEASLQGAASVLGLTTQSIKSAISGDTKLDPKVRAGIMRIAKRAYNAGLDDYNTIRTNFLDRAQESQLNKAAIVPFGEQKPFESIYPDLDIGETPIASDAQSQMKLEAQTLLQQGHSPAEVANALRQKYSGGVPRG